MLDDADHTSEPLQQLKNGQILVDTDDLKIINIATTIAVVEVRFATLYGADRDGKELLEAVAKAV